MGWTATLARHGAAKPHRAGRCSGCCKLKPSGPLHRESSVFFVSETFLRLLLQGFRSASEPSRPPERRARWSLSHLALALKPGILVESQAGPDGKLARVRGPRCPRQPVRHARAAQRVRGLPTAAQSCRAKLCCASRPPVRACPALSIRLGPQFDAAVFHALTGAQEGLVIEYNWVLGPSLVSFARLDTAQSTT